MCVLCVCIVNHGHDYTTIQHRIGLTQTHKSSMKNCWIVQGESLVRTVSKYL